MTEFPHTITFQVETDTPDGSGGFITNWNTFKVSDALVQPISGKTYWEAQKNESKIKYKVFMEYDGEITSGMRIQYGEEILTYSEPIDQGGQEEIILFMCESE
jgi:SPP1 family predicted phage head-tail adaptor